MYPSEKIIPEMIGECVPELKGCGSAIMLRFVKDIIRPYEDSVLESIFTDEKNKKR